MESYYTFHIYSFNDPAYHFLNVVVVLKSLHIEHVF